MKAIYAFSGDPITNGHIDVIERAAATYEQLTVAIGANPAKVMGYLFSDKERLDMARRAVAHLENVDSVIFRGLLAQFAYRNGFNVIVRGVRNPSDLEAEFTLYNVNHLQFATIDTVFLPTKPTLSHVSSSVVKALVREGGDASRYVPAFVKQMLELKISRQIRIGVAGGLGSGKSFVAAALEKRLPDARHIGLDEIGHYILSDSSEPAYIETREWIAKKFGSQLLLDDGSIDRSALGALVFDDSRKLFELNKIMMKPILAHLYEMCRDVPVAENDGVRIILLETGLFVENRLTHLVNHCLVLVTCPEELKIKRLVETRGMTEDEARLKIRREITDNRRRAYLQNMLNCNDSSFLVEFENKEDTLHDAFIEEVKSHIDRLRKT